MGCLSITQLPSFFPPPPPPKRKIACTNLFYPGRERQSERVKYPAHQLNPVTQPWFEPRPVPRESRWHHVPVARGSRGRSSKPANFVRFGEIYVLLTMQTINIAISNCSFYAHTVMRWKCGEVRSKTLTNTFIKKIFSFQLNLIKKVSGLKIPWGILI